MASVSEKHVTGDRRSVMQQARLAIRDVYDAIIELVTNADDRYQTLDRTGTIEIVVDRGRGKTDRFLKVRDFADGMTLDMMDEKLSRTGARVSGLEAGFSVRGTNSRGAKDIAALGSVVFSSIAQSDNRFHECEITDGFLFKPRGTKVASAEMRESLGIPDGTGTLVSLRLGSNHPIPLHDNLVDHIQRLVALRDILADPRRTVILRDSSRTAGIRLRAPEIAGTDRVKETFDVPGYPGSRAKLIVTRSSTTFERESNRFRLSGIVVKSRHAVHEATYFDTELETNPHALWFCGRLTCSAIDDIWNAFDDRFEQGLEPEPGNPVPILDPSRQTGLTREHPFVKALYREALKRLRPLVDEERQREENQQVAIESDATRKRLDALEKAASKFMEEFGEEEAVARDPEGRQAGSGFKARGFVLSPPFAQIVQGHAQKFWLTVNQEVFPELEAGANVQIECLTSDITADRRFAALAPHPQQEGALRAIWTVKALQATPATGIRVQIGPIAAESAIEVFATEADRYRVVDSLQFTRSRYRLYTDGTRKRLRLLAPISRISQDTPLEVALSSRHFKLIGPRLLTPHARLHVAIGELVVVSDGTEAIGTISVRAAGMEAVAELRSEVPAGAGLKISLKDIDLKHNRSRWRQNVIEIATRHPSLKRYLGPAPDFRGQETKHFRVLLAEIVADAICYKILSHNFQSSPEDYENADWDTFYADYSKYVSQFLPIAHKLQCPEGA